MFLQNKDLFLNSIAAAHKNIKILTVITILQLIQMTAIVTPCGQLHLTWRNQ